MNENQAPSRETDESRRRAEAAWPGSEPLAQGILDALTAHVCVLDEGGTILAVNRAWREFAAANQLVGRNVAEGANYLAVCDAAGGPDAGVAAEFAAGIRAVMRGERAEFSLEYPCHAPTEQRWFIGRVSRFPGDGPGCVVVAHENITARKQAEEKLRESEERYRLLIERSGLGVGYYRTDGTILFFNTVAGLALGGEAKEYVGKSIVEVFGQRDGEEYLRRIQVVAAGGSPREFVDLVELPTGRKWFLASYARVLDDTGEVNGVQIIAQDITERKQGEDELRTSQEQLRALAARIQAVREEERTVVAREIHDVLAQELTRLKIDLVWLQRRLARPTEVGAGAGLTVRVAEMIQMADTAIHAVQRIATGLRPAVLDSLGLCAAIEWQMRDFQAHAGIECRVHLPEEEPLLSREAATAAFRILQESLTNVLRHARATRVEISLRPEAGQVMLRIEDNGSGIKPGALTDPMSIGLAGMRERAMLLGGQLAIRSLPDAGTTIEVRLPLAKGD